MRVYCAGPLFNEKEKEEMAEIAQALERHGFEVFLPQRDGLELSKCVQSLVLSEWTGGDRKSAAGGKHVRQGGKRSNVRKRCPRRIAEDLEPAYLSKVAAKSADARRTRLHPYQPDGFRTVYRADRKGRNTPMIFGP